MFKLIHTPKKSIRFELRVKIRNLRLEIRDLIYVARRVRRTNNILRLIKERRQQFKACIKLLAV